MTPSPADSPPRYLAVLSSPWLQRIPALVGWLVLFILLVGAARLRFSVAPVAISEWDSWGWLKPALGWIGGLGFREEYEREWLYGAFIAACLRTTGSFAGYVIIQQILGLVAAVVMWTTWRCWISLFPRNLLLEIGSTWAGITAIGLFLYNPIIRGLEMAIRPEAIMPFVAFGQLLCVVLYCKYRWHHPRAVPSLTAGALAILLAVAMYILKPNWLLAVPLTTLPVFAGIFGSALPRLYRFATPVAGLLLVFLFLWLPDKLLFLRTTEARVVLPMTLFTIHADIIRESMAGELTSQGTTPERRAFLEGFLPLLDMEMAKAREGKIYYTRLGFDPDYLMYRATIFPTLRGKNGMSPQDLGAFCKANFLTALRHEPFLYAGKVFRQLDYFTFPDDATFFRKRIELDSMYGYVLETLPDHPDAQWNEPTRTIFQTYLDSAHQRLTTGDKLESSKRDRNFLVDVRALAPWLCGLFLLALAATLFWSPLTSWRLPGLVLLVFYSAPAGNALTVAMVHALDNSRYRGSYGPLLVFALAGMLVFSVTILACALVLAYRKSRRA
jgi:hypothetical protein